MPVAHTSTIEAQLVSGTWADLSADVLGRVACRYGVMGNGPRDGVASGGEMTFDLNNSAQNSGATLGWYSPVHSGKRTGWTYGIPARWVITYQSAASVSSITRVLQVATVTTGAAHGLTTGEWVTLSGAAQTEYNGTFQVTVTGASTFTVTVTGTPATPATGTLLWVQAYVRFRGKVGDIRPDPGRYRERRVRVVCYDPMRDLMDADVREVSTLVDQTEDTLISAVLSALPATAQPPDTDLDAGLDQYPYAFDNVGAGVKAGSLLNSIVLSGLGALFTKGDGTLVYRTRHARALATTQGTFTDATILDLEAPSSIANAFNHIRTTIHPKTIDAAATTVLWEQTGMPPAVKPGATMTTWATYRSPTNDLQLIGGLSQVTPLVASQDYAANDADDGTGLDRTSDLSVTATPFATTVKFELTNNGTSELFVTLLQLRGKAIYDIGARTFESYVAEDYGDRPITIDLPYQDDPEIGQSAADYLRQQYHDLTTQVSGVRFVATGSAALMAQAMEREPMDCVTLSETVTGLSSVDVIVQSVELTRESSRQLTCRFLLAPASPFDAWMLGTAGRGELGSTTLLGF